MSSSSSSSSSAVGPVFDPNIAIYIGGGAPPEDYFVTALVIYRADTANGLVIECPNEAPADCVVGCLRSGHAQIWRKDGVMWTLLADSADMAGELVDGSPVRMILVKEAAIYSLWVGAVDVTLRAETSATSSSSSSSSQGAGDGAPPKYPGIYLESHLRTLDCFCAACLDALHIAEGKATTDCPVCEFTT